MTHNLQDIGAHYDGRQWNYAERILSCEQNCGYAIRARIKDGRIVEKHRISHEFELQRAIDAGAPDDELIDIAAQYARDHAWSSVPWLKITGLDRRE